MLAKLPFRVPTEPVTAAHCEAIVAGGGDAFVEYMLPHAALRLKQGFGRLIRSGTDRGVVVIADPRIVTKAYGRGLLDGLPQARRRVGPWSDVIEDVRAFYRPLDVIPSEATDLMSRVGSGPLSKDSRSFVALAPQDDK
jgi:ATP-dependent DNA helicase DinG